MSEWITDRLPTEADSDITGNVWLCLYSYEDRENYVVARMWTHIQQGQSWMPIPRATKPKPLPAPVAWRPEHGQKYYYFRIAYKNNYSEDYVDRENFDNSNCFITYEAATEAMHTVIEALKNLEQELLQ